MEHPWIVQTPRWQNPLKRRAEEVGQTADAKKMKSRPSQLCFLGQSAGWVETNPK